MHLFQTKCLLYQIDGCLFDFFQFVYKEVCWRFMSMDYKEGVCIVARWAF